MSNYPTSLELEKAVAKFSLRMMEVAEGLGIEGQHVFRFDFIGDLPNGKPYVMGSTGVSFPPGCKPREVSDRLRGMCDMMDAYWADAFPYLLDKPEDSDGR